MEISTIILLCSGIAVFVWGVIEHLNISDKKQSDEFKEIIGTVVDFRAREDYTQETGSSTIYHPIVEYEVNGNKYTYESITSSYKKRGLGKEIKLMYNINNPEDVMEPIEEKGMATLTVAFGIILIVAGIITMVKLNG